MALQSLLDWCTRNDVSIDSRIDVAYEESRGIHVISRNISIPPNVTLVRIPKRAVLSVKSCAISNYIPFELHGLGAQFGLSFALYSEMLQDDNSRWYGYLRSLLAPDLPIFWGRDSSVAGHETGPNQHPGVGNPLLLLQGTEVWKLLIQRDNMGRTLLENIDHYYHEIVVPVLKLPEVQSLLLREPDLVGFYEAFSLVSSRSFLLDVYHGLAMTPVADAFNHVIENHVHIQSEFYVCPNCGSLRECEHDSDDHDRSLKTPEDYEDHDLYYEMLSNAEILPNEEVYNTYGEKLTNAQLLMQYGFILDPNDNDMVYFDLSEVVDLLPQAHTGKELPLHDSDVDFVFPPQSFDTSGLIFILNSPNPGPQFCINSDGKISFQLWRFMLKRLRESVRLEATLDEFIAIQFRLEAALQELTPASGETDQIRNCGSPGVSILLQLAHLVIKLCERKKENTGYLNCSDEELGDILDTLSQDKKRQKLALSVVMSERSILDGCRFGWLDFIDGLVDEGY